MRKFTTTALAAILVCGAQAAVAQTGDGEPAASGTSIPNAFRGFRVQGDVGYNRFHSQGTHDDAFGYGVSGGFDGVIADRFVIGPDFSYWRTNRAENFTPGVNGGQVAHRAFQEYGAAIRAGYLVQPKLLVYALGGYVNSEQRKSFSGVNGQGGFYDHFHSDGYQLGGGAEFSLTKMFYVGAGYRYSDYDDHTRRQRVYGSVGVRFP